MRRAFVCTLLAVFALGTATALGAKLDFSGHVKGTPNDKITFTVVRTGGVERRVKDVVIHRIGVDCDEGHQRITPGASGTAQIASNGSFDLSSGNVHFYGKVNGNSADGHLRVKGSFSGSSQNCDSGLQAWTAKH